MAGKPDTTPRARFHSQTFSTPGRRWLFVSSTVDGEVRHLRRVRCICTIDRWNNMRRIFACSMCALLLVGLLPLSGHSLDRDPRKIGWERVSLPNTNEAHPWIDSVDDPLPDRDRTSSIATQSNPNASELLNAFTMFLKLQFRLPRLSTKSTCPPGQIDVATNRHSRTNTER